MIKLKSFIKRHPSLSWVFGFQLFRFFILPFMGLMPQDAYYYMYGQNLAWSYFDHPGMIGYLLRLTTEVFGTSVFVVKLTDFLITSITLIVFYKLAQCFLSKQKAYNSLLLITSTLFISILSFNSTPDVPLILFWSLSVLFLYKAIFQNKKQYWLFAGLAMGLAFNSKYTAILLQIGLLFFLLFSKNYRKLFFSKWLWFCLLISILTMFPVWYWNYQNEFASFVFQSSNRASSITQFNVKPKLFLGAVAHQAFLLLPILSCSFLVFSYKHIKKAFIKWCLPSQKTLFLLAFFIPAFIGFFIISPFYWVKINWMMPSYITGCILASFYINKKLLRYQILSSIFIHLLVAVQVIFYVFPIKSDDTWVGWKELSEKVVTLQEKHSTSFLFSVDDYKTSSALRFYLPQETIYGKNVINLPALHFDYLDNNLSRLEGKNALFIDSDTRFRNKNKKGKAFPESIYNFFESVEELEPITIKKGNREIRKFWVFLCKNYKKN